MYINIFNSINIVDRVCFSTGVVLYSYVVRYVFFSMVIAFSLVYVTFTSFSLSLCFFLSHTQISSDAKTERIALSRVVAQSQ